MSRLHFPASARNREPILDVLQRVLPPRGIVLEIGSGSGEHGAHFAGRLAPRIWQPSEANPRCLASIAAYAEAADCPNLRPPIALDARWAVWPVTAAAAVVAVNVVHISPWSVCAGIIAGARRCLDASGILYLYGPYRQDGVPSAPSNERFDQSLRAQNPEWGLRTVEDVARLALAAGLRLDVVEPMPANNLSLVFRRHDG